VLLELQRATHATLQALAVELADLDLTPSELNALGNLADRQPRTVSELGAAVGVRPTTLTGVLDRLERRDLIARAPRPGDRRAVQISLTGGGAETAEQVRQAMRRVERRALAGLAPDVVAAARTVLEALAAR
jgi:DNA-binding MarR family transcriptional regulator